MTRAFLDTNGVRQHVTAVIDPPDESKRYVHQVPAAVRRCGTDLEKACVGEKIEDMFREMIAGTGAVQATIHKYVQK